MKKFILLILLLNIFSLASYSAPRRNADTAELLSYIKKKAANCNTVRMKQGWKQLCEQDKETCEAKQEWFDNLYYETKTRKRAIGAIQMQTR